jgi:hypothetical protein
MEACGALPACLVLVEDPVPVPINRKRHAITAVSTAVVETNACLERVEARVQRVNEIRISVRKDAVLVAHAVDKETLHVPVLVGPVRSPANGLPIRDQAGELFAVDDRIFVQLRVDPLRFVALRIQDVVSDELKGVRFSHVHMKAHDRLSTFLVLRPLRDAVHNNGEVHAIATYVAVVLIVETNAAREGRVAIVQVIAHVGRCVRVHTRGVMHTGDRETMLVPTLVHLERTPAHRRLGGYQVTKQCVVHCRHGVVWNVRLSCVRREIVRNFVARHVLSQV